MEKLLSKRSYVDSASNMLVLLQGGNIRHSTAHVPEKYSTILHIISYRYSFRSKSQGFQVLTITLSSIGMQVRRL